MPNSVELETIELSYSVNEELKTLRTNIQFCGLDKKVILLTSVIANEGKTTLALNLCRSLAELGKRVLLVDADLRKSVLEKRVVQGDVPYGLSHFLSRQCGVNDIFCKVDQGGFYVVFAGGFPPNPVELLASEQMGLMMDKVRGLFDYVIIDTAPLGVVTDAAVLAQLCDGAILVLNAGEIRYKMAQNVVNRLKSTGVSILGVVLNQTNHQRNGRYYGKKYGYYSKYGRYGKYGKYGKYGDYYSHNK